MEQKHALSNILQDIHSLLHEIATAISDKHSCAECEGQMVPSRVNPIHPRTTTLRPALKSSLSQTEWLDRQGVMDYLQISYRTYYRLRASGLIVPQRIGGRDYYFLPELTEQLKESIRKGRI
jgi:hypothetical protein